MLVPLPIDSHVDRIRQHARESRAVVVSAQPGTGKTTRVPPALLEDGGRVILLQPRRVAARAIASRIAVERGWSIGREVGWQVRFERRFSPETRLLVVTEGVLTSRLQADPLLSDFRTVVLDEFHERSIHADLAIALARQAWRARGDLRIIVMSATLDTRRVSEFLDGCPIVEVPGRSHPIDVRYAPGRSLADAAAEAAGACEGDVLCFLPGAAEIRRAITEIEQRLNRRDIDIVPLHGSLDADEQDRAMQKSNRRRIVVATNVAETSITVPGVTAVIDSGLHKIARYDADRGIDSLHLERIPADSAEQRAGRAGRLAPGLVVRLWDSRDRLRPHREPDILRVDLCASALDVIAWGAHPRDFDWFERPTDDALDGALALLERLEVIAGKSARLTPLGEAVRRIPLHPRLARMLVEADGAREIARACAVISERYTPPRRMVSTSSDLLSALDGWDQMPSHVQYVAREIEQRVGSLSPATTRTSAPLSEAAFRRAILTGYPDRVAQRRAPGSDRLLLASGAGAVLGAESGVRDGEFLAAIDVHAVVSAGTQLPHTSNDARVRLASLVDREWLKPNRSAVTHRVDRERGTVKAAVIDYYDAIVLAERPARPDPEIAGGLLAAAWLERGPSDADRQLLRRLRFAGHPLDPADLARASALQSRSMDDIRLEQAVPQDVLRRLERDAPEAIVAPSGRRIPLEYADDGTVSAAVKLQELFGLAETPRIGRQREPVLLSLLAPNGRPVQLTRDLRSFWDRTYPDVRRELRGRYPKHSWPDAPWTAAPGARPVRRKKT